MPHDRETKAFGVRVELVLTAPSALTPAEQHRGRSDRPLPLAPLRPDMRRLADQFDEQLRALLRRSTLGRPGATVAEVVAAHSFDNDRTARWRLEVHLRVPAADQANAASQALAWCRQVAGSVVDRGMTLSLEQSWADRPVRSPDVAPWERPEGTRPFWMSADGSSPGRCRSAPQRAVAAGHRPSRP